jgi:polar amino acid transport system permease protein
MSLSTVQDNFALLLQGLGATAELAVVSLLAGTAIGLVTGGARAARLPVVSTVVRLYVEIFRGSPLLVQLLFVYFGSTYLGLTQVTTFTAAAVAISLYGGAYMSEIFRSGIEAVPRGQSEASGTLGLSGLQTFRYVVLPQTRTIVLPPLVGQYIQLIKDTSLATVIGYTDLLRQGQSIVDRAGHPLEAYLGVAALYFVLCFPLSLLVRHMDRKALAAT